MFGRNSPATSNGDETDVEDELTGINARRLAGLGSGFVRDASYRIQPRTYEQGERDDDME